MHILKTLLKVTCLVSIGCGIAWAEKSESGGKSSTASSDPESEAFTGGVIPEEYLGQPDSTESVENTSTPGNTSAPDNIRVSNPSNHSGSNENAVATNGQGGIIVGWQDSGTRQCCYAFSGDNGETWDHRCLGPTNNSRHAGDATAGASPDGALYAVCMDYSISQIKVSHTVDNGETWSEWKESQSTPDKPWVAGGREGMVYISWLGGNAGWKRSQDYGETWEEVHSIGRINHGTTFGVGGPYVHVLFNQGSGLAYQRSTDYGATAESRRVLVQNQGSFCYSGNTGCNPRMHPIVGGGSDTTGKNVVAVWTSKMNGASDEDVWAVISRDYGETWTNPIRVNTETNARQIQAWAAADEYGRIHVVWSDWRHGNSNVAVYYASTLDNEFSTEEVEITNERSGVSGFYGDYKGLTVDGDDVVVSWVDSRNGRSEVFLARGEGLAADPDPSAVKLTPEQIKSRWTTRSVYNLKGEKVGNVDAPKKMPKGKYLRK